MENKFTVEKAKYNFHKNVSLAIKNLFSFCSCKLS